MGWFGPRLVGIGPIPLIGTFMGLTGGPDDRESGIPSGIPGPEPEVGIEGVDWLFAGAPWLEGLLGVGGPTPGVWFIPKSNV